MGMDDILMSYVHQVFMENFTPSLQRSMKNRESTINPLGFRCSLFLEVMRVIQV